MINNTLYTFLVLIVLFSNCKVSKPINRNPERKTTFTIIETPDSSRIAPFIGHVKDLGDSGPIPYGMVIIKQNGVNKHHAFIDSSGTFVLNNVESGQFNIQVTCEYFKTVEMPIEIKSFTKVEIFISIMQYEIELIDMNK